jgi:hypothetical protein
MNLPLFWSTLSSKIRQRGLLPPFSFLDNFINCLAKNHSIPLQFIASVAFYFLTILIKVSEEGTYLAIENSNNIIYKSTNAQVWDKYFSISELTNNFSYSPQAFAMDKNIAFILSNNNTLIRIDTENDNTRVYDYSGNTWRTPNNVLDVLIQAVDGKVFLLDNYADNLRIISPMEGWDKEFVLDSSPKKMFKSQGNVYFVDYYSNIYRCTENGIHPVSLPELEFETYKLEVLGFYKNNPVIKTGSRFFIYKY